MHSDPMGGKRSNARMPGSLDILKDCIIFVDVRTEEGEDAAALFIDMLRGLGARVSLWPLFSALDPIEVAWSDPREARQELHAPCI